MNVALRGYKLFGKRMSESLLKYWGGKYCVTKIYDPSCAGEHDPFWDVTVETPDSIEADYGNGSFEAVMICIMTSVTRIRLEEDFAKAGIPVIVPGDEADLLPPEGFGGEPVTDMLGCRIFRYRDVMASPAYFYDNECVYVFNSDGKVLNSQWITNEGFDPGLPLMYPFRLRDPLPEKIRMPGSYCILTKEFSSNYWHFTFQCLSEAYLLERSGFTGTYIINDRPYNRDVMIMMGISPDRIVTAESLSVNKIYVFDELYGAEIDFRDKAVNTDIIARLSASIRSRLKKDTSYPSKIYVKRIGSRKLINGDDIADRFGFTAIVPEELSVREQLEYFFNADIVLCPHGANSTNCIYMHEGSVFIEVFSERWYKDINSDICLKNRIYHLKAVGSTANPEQHDMAADYMIPEDTASRLVEEACRLAL